MELQTVDAQGSHATYKLPYQTETSPGGEDALIHATKGHRYLCAFPITHEQGLAQTARLDWLEIRPSVEPGTSKQSVICYYCYSPGHISTEYSLPVHQMHQIIANYEALTEAELRLAEL